VRKRIVVAVALGVSVALASAYAQTANFPELVKTGTLRGTMDRGVTIAFHAPSSISQAASTTPTHPYKRPPACQWRDCTSVEGFSRN
jgi:hypothetical protein